MTPGHMHSSLTSTQVMSLVQPLPQFVDLTIVQCLITCMTLHMLKQTRQLAEVKVATGTIERILVVVRLILIEEVVSAV